MVGLTHNASFRPRRGDGPPRPYRVLALPVIGLLACALLTGAPPALAQSPLVAPSNGQRSANGDEPMLLQADEMVYNNQNNTVVARGNVEIYYNNYTLLADQVTYDQNANTLAAEGNVRIKEPGGALIKSDRITLTDDFRDGFLRSLRIVTADESRIAAASASRESGETTIFNQAVYTPCKPCEENPEAPPTWRIRATRVIHRKSEATITYENAWFDFLGQPIAWVPWFQHADPSVKRKSGFLTPSFSSSSDLGFTAEVPYYFALSPSYDFIFSPKFTERQGVLWKGRWRQRTATGIYDVDLAGIFQQDPEATAPHDDTFRGSIKTRGNFAINERWDWGWDITASTDDTFRRYYDLDNILQTDRISQVYLTGLYDRNYFDLRFYQFGGLTFNDTSTSNYQVHPIIDYNYIFSDPVLGGELSFNSNVMSLTREDGADSSRLITELNWRRQLVDARGQIFTPFAGMRGDIYQVSNVVDPVTEESFNDDTITRGSAFVGGEYRYPFVAHGRRADHVVEPIAQVVARPSIRDQDEIPNEDARSLVYDDTLLFDIDKFSGYDRIESGTRVNYGLRYTMQRYLGGYLQAVLGQSVQLAGDNDFPKDSGLNTTSSDYVTGIYLEPSPYLSFITQMRFDEGDFGLKRTDLGARGTYGPITARVDYANLRAQPGLEIYEDREEVKASGSLLMTRNWSLFGDIRYDLEKGRKLTDSIGLRYADDCFALAISYEESFIEDDDIEPSETVMFRFEFKNLGAFDIETDPTLLPDSEG